MMYSLPEKKQRKPLYPSPPPRVIVFVQKSKRSEHTNKSRTNIRMKIVPLPSPFVFAEKNDEKGKFNISGVVAGVWIWGCVTAISFLGVEVKASMSAFVAFVAFFVVMLDYGESEILGEQKMP
eukprot:1379834-Amorphochlora_amoeboformis.AAC.1